MIIDLRSTRKLHAAVRALPIVAIEAGLPLDQLRRANVVLGMLVHSYLNGSLPLVAGLALRCWA